MSTPEKQCERFNVVGSVGRLVCVEKDDGSSLVTRTRSEAYVLSGHTAVVFLEGVRGCYALEKVRAVSVQISATGGE